MAAGRQCGAVKPDGTRCRAPALSGSDCCFFHSPEAAGARAEANRQGGKTRSKGAAVLPAETPDVPLGTVGDVVTFLGRTVNDVRKGALDCKAGNCVGYLSSVLLRALEG